MSVIEKPFTQTVSEIANAFAGLREKITHARNWWEDESETTKEVEQYFAEKAASEKRLKESLQKMTASQFKRATRFFTYSEKKQYAK